MRHDLLKTVLDKLNQASADIATSAIISSDGLMSASSLPGELEQDRVGALSAALLSIGTRLAAELGRGQLQQLVVKAELGYLIAVHAGPETVLVAVIKPGLAAIDVLRAAEAAGLVMQHALSV